MSSTTIISKRQFRSANVKKAFRPSRARGNVAAAHMDFRTRTVGSSRQIGQKFPITLQKGHLGPQRWSKKALHDKPKTITSLEIGTIKAERDMESHGVKGFMIGIRLKDGTRTEIPLMAQSWHEAFFIAHKSMMNYNPNDIDEITIVDPSLSEIVHKIGAGAHRLAGGIKKGAAWAEKTAKTTYRKAEAAAMTAARQAGRIGALPEEVQEQYEIGRARRPEITSEATATLAPPYTASELSAAQELIAKRRAATATMTPSEIERRKRSSRQPFQSRVFGSNGITSSVTSKETDTTLGKAKEHLRKAKWALKGALG